MNNKIAIGLKVSRWVHTMVAKARVFSSSGSGEVTKARFYELAAGEKATKILKEIGMYDRVVAEYEAEQGGPIDEIFDVEVDEVVATPAIDPVLLGLE